MEINAGHMFLDEYSNMGYDGNAVAGGYGFPNGGVGGLTHGW